jgi:hypothetical protein
VEPPQAPIHPPPVVRRPDGCLTILLIVWAGINAASLYFILSGHPIVAKMTNWPLPALFVGHALSIVFCLATLAWKRWGAYGLCGFQIIGLITDVVNLRWERILFDVLWLWVFWTLSQSISKEQD